MSLKEIVYVKVSPIIFEEGIIVGKIIFQGNVTYRVLINDKKIIDATDEQILSKAEYIRYAEDYKNESIKN